MTKQEFIENVTTFTELHDFCESIDFYLTDQGAYSQLEYDDYINDDLEYMARDNNWYELRDYLSGLPEDYAYYRRDDLSGDWYGCSENDIDDLKQEALEYADENCLFDEPEEEYEEEPEEDSETDPDEAEDDDCDIAGFIWGGAEYPRMSAS